jgi:hypothetical protein
MVILVAEAPRVATLPTRSKAPQPHGNVTPGPLRAHRDGLKRPSVSINTTSLSAVGLADGLARPARGPQRICCPQIRAEAPQPVGVAVASSGRAEQSPDPLGPPHDQDPEPPPRNRPGRRHGRQQPLRRPPARTLLPSAGARWRGGARSTADPPWRHHKLAPGVPTAVWRRRLAAAGRYHVRAPLAAARDDQLTVAVARRRAPPTAAAAGHPPRARALPGPPHRGDPHARANRDRAAGRGRAPLPRPHSSPGAGRRSRAALGATARRRGFPDRANWARADATGDTGAS